MRAFLLAGVIALALSGSGYAQSFTAAGSGTIGSTSAGAGSLSAVAGNGENVSGGLAQATTIGGDVSVAGHLGGTDFSATGGGSNSTVTEVTFSQGSGSNIGTAAAGGFAHQGFAGVAVSTHH